MLVEDTETLIALVSSLLEGPPPSQESVLETLADCDGDVCRAAQLMNSRGSRRGGKEKRKHEGKLDGWLDSSPSKSARPIKRTRSLSPPRQSTSSESVLPNTRNKPASTSSSSHTKVKSLTKQEFMSILRPSSSSAAPSKPSPPRHPPLTLATPELIAKHTPCTLHTSILPPELACRCVFWGLVVRSSFRPSPHPGLLSLGCSM